MRPKSLNGLIFRVINKIRITVLAHSVVVHDTHLEFTARFFTIFDLAKHVIYSVLSPHEAK